MSNERLSRNWNKILNYTIFNVLKAYEFNDKRVWSILRLISSINSLYMWCTVNFILFIYRMLSTCSKKPPPSGPEKMIFFYSIAELQVVCSYTSVPNTIPFCKLYAKCISALKWQLHYRKKPGSLYFAIYKD